MKKITALLLILALIVSITACSKKGDSEQPDVTTAEEVENADSLTACRKQIKDDGCLIGGAYLGMDTDYETDLLQYLIRSAYWDGLPLVRDIPEERYFEESGDDVFVVVPLEGVKITLFLAQLNTVEGGYTKDSTIYESESGAPFVVQGNMGDNRMVVRAEKDGKTVEILLESDGNGKLVTEKNKITDVCPF